MAADLWLILAMIESGSASEASEIALLGLIMLLSSPPTSLKLEDLSSDVNGNKYLASPRHNWEPSLRSYPQTPVERSRHILLAPSHQLDRCTQEPRVNGSGYAAPSSQSSRLDPGKNHLITSLPSRHELVVSSFHLKRLQHNSQAESQQSSRA
ncbi:hypothetical protein Bca4012_071589 [Brassica carinata]